MRFPGAALAAMLVAVPPAVAQQPPVAPPPGRPAGMAGIGAPPGQPPATIVAEPIALAIATCDRDGDALVTRAELAPCVARGFALVAGTASAIGYIAYGDWARRWLGDANALPSPFSVDADADNSITLVELQAFFAQTFARLDLDHDGQLTRAELLTIRSGVAPDLNRRRRGR